MNSPVLLYSSSENSVFRRLWFTVHGTKAVFLAVILTSQPMTLFMTPKLMCAYHRNFHIRQTFQTFMSFIIPTIMCAHHLTFTWSKIPIRMKT